MDRRSEQAALLAILRQRQRGWGAIADEVESRGSALAVLREPPRGQVTLFSDAGEEDSDGRLAESRHAIEGWAAEQINLATLLDPEYPPQLLTIHERPPFL